MRTVSAVAYLGFQKEGAICLLATSAHTKGGQTKFSNFFSMSTNIFLAKGGPWPIWPRGKYATACQKLYDIQQGNLVDELERNENGKMYLWNIDA